MDRYIIVSLISSHNKLIVSIFHSAKPWHCKPSMVLCKLLSAPSLPTNHLQDHPPVGSKPDCASLKDMIEMGPKAKTRYEEPKSCAT